MPAQILSRLKNLLNTRADAADVEGHRVAEGGGFGVLSVRPADLHRRCVFPRQRDELLLKRNQIGNDNVFGEFFEPQSGSGIKYIRRCREQVDIRTRFGTNFLSDDVDERADVVPDTALLLVDILRRDECNRLLHFIGDFRGANTVVCKGAHQGRLHFRLIGDVACLGDVGQEPVHKCRVPTVVSEI